MSEHTPETQVVVDTATAAAGPQPLGAFEGLFTVVVPEGSEVVTLDALDLAAGHAPQPPRKTGRYTAASAESFVAYLAKHGTPDTEVWADPVGARIVGVINAHGDALAGWGDHRITYSVATTKAWDAWTAKDGQLLSQTDFAELIEDRLIDIVRPAGADMLELAQAFEATIGVRYESSRLLSSGERQLSYRETVDAKAGRAGKVEIPRDFDLALIPFEGAEAFRVTARFRYRITDGVLRIGYRLNRPEDVLREAFESVVARVDDGTEAPVFRGVSA